MKRSKFLEMIGFRYVLNHNPRSLEIHRVDDLKKNCNVEAMTNAGYHTKLSQFIARKWFGYDGCAKCNKKFHTK
jgi:hypothetical protein